ncbi:hypothetical protein [Coraliomargarita parva]|uniref:hypothetical protein n=1 Tax=Coraliomargarita parva TaxID=3014050 RepID=UPI0022B5743B|nr:hypothetical protein [Coraliomargarita parva]
MSDVQSVENGADLASSLVTLVPSESDSSGTVSEKVEAGVESIEDTGNYAWWVGDENIKAKLGNPLVAATNQEEAMDQLESLPRANHEFLLGAGIDAEDVAKLSSDAQFSVANASLDWATTPYRHDYSLFAEGLLTNVRSGGFRKDLSLLLQQPLDDLNDVLVLYEGLGDVDDPLYTANGEDGFTWFEMWRDFNVWGEIQYLNSPPAHEDGGAIAAGTPFFVAEATPADAADDPFLAYKHFTVLKTDLVYSLTATTVAATADSPETYNLHLVCDPIFTIWNPSNIGLQIPSSTATTFKVWRPPYTLTLYVDGAPKYFNFKDLYTVNFFYARVGRAQDLVMRPGEVQIQSQGFNTPMESMKAFDKHEIFNASIGWEDGSGYKTPALDYAPEASRDGTQVLTYSLFPNTSNLYYALVLTGTVIGWNQTKPNTPDFQNYGSHSIASKPVSINATQFPDVFPTIANDVNISHTVEELSYVDTLTNKPYKWALADFSFGVKTEVDPEFDLEPGARRTGRSLLRFNPSTPQLTIYDLQDNMQRASSLQIGMRRLSDMSEAVELTPEGLGYFGASYGSYDGVTHFTAYTVAESPIHSLGAAQNFIPDGGTTSKRKGSLQPFIMQAIGNSFAPSVIAANTTYAEDQGITYADHSYLVNEVLWDDYFFSSIDPVTVPVYKDSTTAYQEQLDRFEDFVGLNSQDSVPLPNSRMLAWLEDPEDPGQTVSQLFASGKPRADAYKKVGANLLVDGMFNVNSTSVAAWKALLGGLKDMSMPVRSADATSANVTLTQSSNAVVPASVTASGGEIDPSTLTEAFRNDPDQWLGFRTLTDDQLEELAEAIVEQVRLRGPFLSLADFINRRISTDVYVAVSGALQSALDDASVSINQAYRQGTRSLTLGEAQSDNFPFPEAEAGVKSVAAPGYVDQADLLTPLGPLLSARSDTFTIRAYGDSLGFDGSVQSRVYVEAIVQRTPDYVDGSDDNEEDASDLSDVNQLFGRKFRIVSFRVIDPDDLS